MQFKTGGQQAELIYKPWFNWIMMGGFGLLSLGGFVYFQLALPGMRGQQAEIVGTMSWAIGFTGLISCLGVLITPTKTIVFDRALRQFTFRSDYVFGKMGKARSVSEIAGLDVKRVKGNGPEAYWMKLKLKTGKKLKFAPHAFQPADARKIKAIIQATVKGGGSAPTPARPAQGQAPRRQGFGRAARV